MSMMMCNSCERPVDTDYVEGLFIGTLFFCNEDCAGNYIAGLEAENAKLREVAEAAKLLIKRIDLSTTIKVGKVESAYLGDVRQKLAALDAGKRGDSNIGENPIKPQSDPNEG